MLTGHEHLDPLLILTPQSYCICSRLTITHTGTCTAGDWLRNLQFLSFVSMLRPYTPCLHPGFAIRSNEHFAAMLLALAKLFNNDLSRIGRLTFSGHSLGGAVAQATAFRLRGWLIRALSDNVLAPTPRPMTYSQYTDPVPLRVWMRRQAHAHHHTPRRSGRSRYAPSPFNQYVRKPYAQRGRP